MILSSKNAAHGGRGGFTVLELLVTITVIGVLVALILPAVQQARGSASRMDCQNRMRQLGIALHSFESTYGKFPSGKTTRTESPQTPDRTWLCSILPYVEQSAMWDQSQAAYRISRLPYNNPPHTPMGKALLAFACPDDSRTHRPQSASALNNAYVGLTSYLGVAGTSNRNLDGMFYSASATQTRDILDGLSNSLMVGERPPSPDFNYGWWYTGSGQDGTGNCDMFLGVTEELVAGAEHLPSSCRSVNKFEPGKLDQPCDTLHFWSLHSGGGNFLWCDGSVKFMAYQSASILPKLSTIAGGE